MLRRDLKFVLKAVAIEHSSYSGVLQNFLVEAVNDILTPLSLSPMSSYFVVVVDIASEEPPFLALLGSTSIG